MSRDLTKPEADYLKACEASALNAREAFWKVMLENQLDQKHSDKFWRLFCAGRLHPYPPKP